MSFVSPLLSDEQRVPLVERRAKPRVECSYPAILRGHSGGKDKFETRAILSNMSASGMFLRTKRYVQQGEILFVVVRLSTAPLNGHDEAHRLAASGKVVRIEPKADGTYGVALQLHQYRFL